MDDKIDERTPWADLWDFARTRKKLWLLPLFILAAMMGLLMFMMEGSDVSPFVYTLF